SADSRDTRAAPAEPARSPRVSCFTRLLARGLTDAAQSLDSRGVPARGRDFVCPNPAGPPARPHRAAAPGAAAAAPTAAGNPARRSAAAGGEAARRAAVPAAGAAEAG